MISKQLFISFLFLCSFVPVNAFKHDTLGVGIPYFGSGTGPNNNSLNLTDFYTIDSTMDPGAITTPTTGGLSDEDDYTFPSPEEEIPHHHETEEEEEEVPHGANGHHESSDGLVGENNGNAGEAAVDVFVGTQSAEDLIPLANKREEVPRDYYKEALAITNMARHLILNNPKYIISGATSIVMIYSGYSWWQRHRTHSHINNVLKKYGKSISTISPIQMVLMLAAHNKDFNAVHLYLTQYGMEPAQGTENAWIMPALETLFSR